MLLCGNDRFLLRVGAGMLTVNPPSRQPNQKLLASGQRLNACQEAVQTVWGTRQTRGT